MPANIDAAIGADGKPVIIKRSIFEKNAKHHPELSAADGKGILERALYNPNLVGRTQPVSRPTYKVAIQTGDRNAVTVLEVSQTKDNVEIIGWRNINERGLELMKKQAAKGGGQLLVLHPSENGQPVGLSGRQRSSTGESISNLRDEGNGENAAKSVQADRTGVPDWLDDEGIADIYNASNFIEGWGAAISAFHRHQIRTDGKLNELRNLFANETNEAKRKKLNNQYKKRINELWEHQSEVQPQDEMRDVVNAIQSREGAISQMKPSQIKAGAKRSASMTKPPSAEPPETAPAAVLKKTVSTAPATKKQAERQGKDGWRKSVLDDIDKFRTELASGRVKLSGWNARDRAIFKAAISSTENPSETLSRGEEARKMLDEFRDSLTEGFDESPFSAAMAAAKTPAERAEVRKRYEVARNEYAMRKAAQQPAKTAPTSAPKKTGATAPPKGADAPQGAENRLPARSPPYGRKDGTMRERKSKAMSRRRTATYVLAAKWRLRTALAGLSTRRRR